MQNLESFLISLAVLFPCLSGLIRLPAIRPLFRPFIALVTIAAVTEVISFITIRMDGNNSAIINVYSLVEYALILCQFYCWRYQALTRRWYPWLGLLLAVGWVVENLVTGSIHQVGPVFRVGSAFILVILSVNEINYLIIHENRNLLKNARFLICMGFVIYFLYQILLEGSFYISQQENNVTANKIIELFTYVNLMVNIIYGIAVWFIPKKIFFNFKSPES
ncbi:MAG: hypothetical protein ABW019_13810 [Chitinophagaceae bacterium]